MTVLGAQTLQRQVNKQARQAEVRMRQQRLPACKQDARSVPPGHGALAPLANQ